MNHIKLFEEFSVNESSFKTGDKVKVSEGSGTASGRIATVVDKSKIKTDGTGVPTNVQGAYKKVDWSREVAIQYEDGEYNTMFNNRLTKVIDEAETNSYPAPKFARKPAAGDKGYNYVAKQFGTDSAPKKKKKNSRTEEAN